jgi:D-sedoheptulose 7-phosphate isomerase
MKISEKYIEKTKKLLDNLDHEAINNVIDIIFNTYRKKRQIFIIGNGGSASTASHFACDLNQNIVEGNRPHFRAISLTDNITILTAISNDKNYEDVFTEQLKRVLHPNDLLIAISGSGNSPNVVKALIYAKKNKAITIGMLGFNGGIAQQLTDYSIHVKSNHYGRIEDIHLLLEHLICDCLLKKVNGKY